MTLTKADIVANVYAQGMLTKAEASQSVEASLTLIKDALATGDEVLVSGFGKWSVRQKAQRRGRNPQTGDPLILPPRKVVTFRPSRVLKSKVQVAGDGGGAASAPAPEAKEAKASTGHNGGSVIRKGYF